MEYMLVKCANFSTCGEEHVITADREEVTWPINWGIIVQDNRASFICERCKEVVDGREQGKRGKEGCETD